MSLRRRPTRSPQEMQRAKFIGGLLFRGRPTALAGCSAPSRAFAAKPPKGEPSAVNLESGARRSERKHQNLEARQGVPAGPLAISSDSDGDLTRLPKAPVPKARAPRQGSANAWKQPLFAATTSAAAAKLAPGVGREDDVDSADLLSIEDDTERIEHTSSPLGGPSPTVVQQGGFDLEDDVARAAPSIASGEASDAYLSLREFVRTGRAGPTVVPPSAGGDADKLGPDAESAFSPGAALSTEGLSVDYCIFCYHGTRMLAPDNTALLTKFVSERGFILPKRFTKCCAKHQRKLGATIKRSRWLNLLPWHAKQHPKLRFSSMSPLPLVAPLASTASAASAPSFAPSAPGGGGSVRAAADAADAAVAAALPDRAEPATASTRRALDATIADINRMAPARP